MVYYLYTHINLIAVITYHNLSHQKTFVEIRSSFGGRSVRELTHLVLLGWRELVSGNRQKLMGKNPVPLQNVLLHHLWGRLTNFVAPKSSKVWLFELSHRLARDVGCNLTWPPGDLPTFQTTSTGDDQYDSLFLSIVNQDVICTHIWSYVIV